MRHPDVRDRVVCEKLSLVRRVQLNLAVRLARGPEHVIRNVPHVAAPVQNSRFVKAESQTSHVHLVDSSGGTHSSPHTLELARAGGWATVGNGQKRSETAETAETKSRRVEGEEGVRVEARFRRAARALTCTCRCPETSRSRTC